MATLLIKNADMVITHDEQRRQIRGGGIFVRDNVIEQVGNVALSTVIQDAWARGQPVCVHGWVYGLRDGLLKDLQVTMDRPETVVDTFSAAIKRYPRVSVQAPATGPAPGAGAADDDD